LVGFVIIIIIIIIIINPKNKFIYFCIKGIYKWSEYK